MDFGRMNLNLRGPSEQLTGYGGSNLGGGRVPNNGPQPQKREHFSEYSQQSEDHYGLVPTNKHKELKCESYHDPEIRKQYTIGKTNNASNGNAPLGYSSEQLQTPGPSAFYPLDSDAGKPHILNYSFDYNEEPQLTTGTCNKATGEGCGGAFKHLTECSDCRKKLIMAMDKKDASKETTETSPNMQIDATELALFIACGVFFIFLLDAIVKVTKRFVK
jgi:hypothetical protein